MTHRFSFPCPSSILRYRRCHDDGKRIQRIRSTCLTRNDRDLNVELAWGLSEKREPPPTSRSRQVPSIRKNRLIFKRRDSVYSVAVANVRVFIVKVEVDRSFAETSQGPPWYHLIPREHVVYIILIPFKCSVRFFGRADNKISGASRELSLCCSSFR